MCGRQIERNLVVFLDHTDQHIIDKIKELHPEWVEADGICKPCAEYYRKELTGSELSDANIGPHERQKRFGMGIVMLVLSFAIAYFFHLVGSSRSVRLFLFLPIFFGMLGLVQAQEKTCALLAERGLKNMDAGEMKVEDVNIEKALRIRGRAILIKSALLALLLTAFLFFYPR